MGKDLSAENEHASFFLVLPFTTLGPPFIWRGGGDAVKNFTIFACLGGSLMLAVTGIKLDTFVQKGAPAWRALVLTMETDILATNS